MKDDDAAISLLALEGVGVDVATSGTSGLAAAFRRQYAAIILDLNLPDIAGLTLLERMKAARLSIPVMMLTGFGDTESAVRAMKLGARDFRCKPIFGNELTRAVLDLIAAGEGALGTPQNGSEEKGELLSSELARVAQALASPTIDPIDFIALAYRFGLDVAATGSGIPPRHVAPGPHGAETVVRAMIWSMVDILARGRLPSMAVVANAAALSPPEISSLLRANIGRGFRECRQALRIRPVVQQIGLEDSQVAQIGYRHGYEYPSQLNRDFRRVLRVTPRQFRAILFSGNC